nr:MULTISPECIES: OmpA family protein [Myxococcaceae]
MDTATASSSRTSAPAPSSRAPEVSADRDGDGVADARDACPTEPGPAPQGCPAPAPAPQAPVAAAPQAEAQRARAEAVKHVEAQVCLFAWNSSALSQACPATLDDVARTLQAHEELELVVVEGHADSEGPPAYNRRLSQARAEAVRHYLLQRGVAPERLQTRGRGSEQPEAAESTRAGRRANRRVRLVVQVQPGEQTSQSEAY